MDRPQRWQWRTTFDRTARPTVLILMENILNARVPTDANNAVLRPRHIPEERSPQRYSGDRRVVQLTEVFAMRIQGASDLVATSPIGTVRA